jgi:hypothetical protein
LRGGENMTHKLEDNKLTIEFDLNSKQMSKTGKSILLASSNGFTWVGDIGISYNIIKKI